MTGTRRLAVGMACAALALAAPERARGQFIEPVLGGAAGVLAGGYITLSIVVTQAQFGDYLHDLHDVLGWRSLPVLIGGGTGFGLGIVAPDRLKTAVVYGIGGTAAGLGLGLVIGPTLLDAPEAKWVGGAIGAGAGMALGSLLGMLYPRFGGDDGEGPGSSANASPGVPIGFTVRF